MSNAADLKTRTVKELTELAKKRKVVGWHDMRKDELVRALKRQAKKAAAKRSTCARPSNGVARTNGATKVNGAGTLNGAARANGAKGEQAKNGQSKNGQSSNGHAKNGHTTPLGKLPVNLHVGNGHSKDDSQPGKTAAHGPSQPSSSAGPNGTHITLQETEKLALLREKALIEKGPRPHSPQAERRLQEIKTRLAEAKDLAFHALKDDRNGTRDRLVVMVRDPYWLHAYWELGRRSVQRAEVAMGQYWHAGIRCCVSTRSVATAPPAPPARPCATSKSTAA